MTPFIASQARSIPSRSSSVPLTEIAFGLALHLSIHWNRSCHVCKGVVVVVKLKRKEEERHPNNFRAIDETLDRQQLSDFNRSTFSKKYQRKHKKAVSFHQQLLRSFSESWEEWCIVAHIHTLIVAGTTAGEEEKAREREDRERYRD